MTQLIWLAYAYEHETYLSKMYYPDQYSNPNHPNKSPNPLFFK